MTGREDQLTVEMITDSSAVSQKVADALNYVIVQALNSRDIFRDAAAHATTPELTSQFIDWKHKRDQFALDLQHWVARIGHDPEVEPTIIGWMQRQFVKAKAIIDFDTNSALVHELQKEEQSLIDVIDEALAVEELPASVRDRLNLEKREAEVIQDTMARLEGSIQPPAHIDFNRQQN